MGDPESAAGASPPADHSLIQSFLQSGDPAAFRKLVERHLPPVRRLLYTLFNGQREEIEDAEQEIILSLLQGLGSFQFRSSFRTYFYRLARNRGIDCLRRKRSRERVLVRLRSGLGNEQAHDPEEQALRGEELRSLLEVFHTLPSRDRQLILMKDVEGFSVEEVAGILKVPVGTVKSRLHRAREKLARRLGRSEGQEVEHGRV